MHKRSPGMVQETGHRPHSLWVATIVLLFALLAPMLATAGFGTLSAQLASQAGQSHGFAAEATDRHTPWAVPNRVTEVTIRDGRRAGPEAPATPHSKYALPYSTPTSPTRCPSDSAVAPVPVTIVPGYPRHFYSSQAPPSLIG